MNLLRHNLEPADIGLLHKKNLIQFNRFLAAMIIPLWKDGRKSPELLGNWDICNATQNLISKHLIT